MAVRLLLDRRISLLSSPQMSQMDGAIRATTSSPKSFGFRDMLLALFRRLSKGSSKQGPQTQPDHTSDSHPVESPPLVGVGSAKIADQSSQGSQSSGSRKSSADESCISIPTLDRRVRIETNHQVSKVHFQPIYSPESTTPSSPRTSALSPSSALLSPDTPSGSRRQWPSPIKEEPVDLSCQVTLMSPSPIFEGTYSRIYKGSYQGQEASTVF